MREELKKRNIKISENDIILSDIEKKKEQWKKNYREERIKKRKIDSKYNIRMPINIYGLVAALFFTYDLSPVKNVLTLGGSALFGLGAGSLIRPLTLTLLRKYYDKIKQNQSLRKIVRIIVGFLAAEFVNLLILVIASIVDTDIRNLSLQLRIISLQYPIVFWLIYLFQSKSLKIKR